jgi:hypothetical protein
VTRREFVDKATRDAERRIGVSAGWWGTWRDITDGAVRVRFTGSAWRVSRAGKKVSDHDSRSSAISKAKKVRR